MRKKQWVIFTATVFAIVLTVSGYRMFKPLYDEHQLNSNQADRINRILAGEEKESFEYMHNE